MGVCVRVRLDVNLVRVFVLLVVVLNVRRGFAWSHRFVSVLFCSLPLLT